MGKKNKYLSVLRKRRTDKLDFGFIKLITNGLDYIFGSKCNHDWFDTHIKDGKTYQQCYWCDGTRKK